MTLLEQARKFRELFNQETLDNISRYGFIKKKLWDMQVALITEEAREFLDASDEVFADPENQDARHELLKELSDLVFVCYQFAAAFNLDRFYRRPAWFEKSAVVDVICQNLYPFDEMIIFHRVRNASDFDLYFVI